MGFLTNIWAKIGAFFALILSVLGAILIYGQRKRSEGRDDLRQEEREKIGKAEREKYEMEKSNRSDSLDALRDRMREYSDKL